MGVGDVRVHMNYNLGQRGEEQTNNIQNIKKRIQMTLKREQLP